MAPEEDLDGPVFQNGLESVKSITSSDERWWMRWRLAEGSDGSKPTGLEKEGGGGGGGDRSVDGFDGPRFQWSGEVGLITAGDDEKGLGGGGAGGRFGWCSVSKWSGERSSSPLGSREGLHGPPIWSGVGQGFGWSRQKQLVLVWSCRSQRATRL